MSDTPKDDPWTQGEMSSSSGKGAAAAAGGSGPDKSGGSGPAEPGGNGPVGSSGGSGSAEPGGSGPAEPGGSGPAGSSGGSGPAESSGDSAEVLRERQRLAQIESMDRWIQSVLVEQRRSRRWKLFFRFAWLALLLGVAALVGFALLMVPGDEREQARHLGVVKVDGVIDSESPANAERLIEGIEAAWESPSSAAVVLHINSPGGSPVQSQRVYKAVMALRERGDKPIVAVVEDLGASGAYYMASAADEIVAAPSSLVGSIGVIYAGFGLEGAIDDLGVERRVFTAGDNKAFLDPFSEMRPEQQAFWQEVLDTTHQQFIDAVKAGRGDRLADDPRIFSGLIWTGEQALELGLVDRLGTLDEEAHEWLDQPRIKDYTPSQDPFDRLARRFGVGVAQWMGLPQASSPVRYQLP
ncbi:signal peptide peptidase SppA [Halomonas sp. BN3-1]|uniref:signal peptide peptidase SppA n=1 Tax=Halomonas sp. BN3-1 TaxID=2082393 RepID=UPI001F05BFD5|nr:signal peptide peptidase SppA [Halomonas sp. BN3-1]